MLSIGFAAVFGGDLQHVQPEQRFLIHRQRVAGIAEAQRLAFTRFELVDGGAEQNGCGDCLRLGVCITVIDPVL
ncbi:hypothetical protein IV04_14920 [Serratia sp. Ag1]|nr:hypothetical protein IV04_14920 [Serratia sp. Ag1]